MALKKETRLKISKKMRGLKRSEETKKRMSLGKGGTGFPTFKGKSRKRKEEIAGRPMPQQCEICGALREEFKRGFHFDHDHKTGKFRGWICSRCNLALGLVKDNTQTLQSMIDYLNSNIKVAE